MKKIVPKILQGTRDFLPEAMAKRLYVMNIIRDVFKRFGFDTVETPVIEYAETLLGKYGEEGSRLVYRFEDNGGRDIALRYDQTVPFARLVAANYPQLVMPFKCYQISRVWRADRPAKGRYREFYQCDVDIIGTESLLAEVEIAKIIQEVFFALGLKKIQIRFNSRRLLDEILSQAQVEPNLKKAVIGILDKILKVGEEKVKKELTDLLDEQRAELLLQSVLVKGTNQEKLKQLDLAATKEVAEFIGLCRDYQIEDSVLVFDPALARGLDYYTGIVFEVYSEEVEVGSICGGGRYDDLCALFCEQKFSGVGVAFGFDRIMFVLDELARLQAVPLSSSVLVTYFDETSLPASLQILNEIRAADINAEIYFEAAKLAKQFKYADKKKAEFVVICGPDELKNEQVTVRTLSNSKQISIPRRQLVSYLKGYDN